MGDWASTCSGTASPQRSQSSDSFISGNEGSNLTSKIELLESEARKSATETIKANAKPELVSPTESSTAKVENLNADATPNLGLRDTPSTGKLEVPNVSQFSDPLEKAKRYIANQGCSERVSSMDRSR